MSTKKQKVEQYKAGRLTPAEQPNVTSHYGTAAAPGSTGFRAATGIGRGGRRGGGHRAMGSPGGALASFQPGSLAPEAAPEDELNTLKRQAQWLAEKMQQIQQRIENLEVRQKQGSKK
jgi:hypothetical protein